MRVGMGFRTGSVEIKGPKEIERMREVGRLAAETLMAVGDIVRPGISTDEIDRFVHEHTLGQGAKPAPLNYKGFPKSVCTSVNEVVCHGIPGNRVLKDGDIVNVDVTHIYKGFHGDTSATFYVGTPSEDAKRVTEVARKSLELGIAQVKPGGRLGDIGAAIQELAEAHGCSVVRDFVGRDLGSRHPPQAGDDLHHRAHDQPGHLGSPYSRRRLDRRHRRRPAFRAVRAHGAGDQQRLRGPDGPRQAPRRQRALPGLLWGGLTHEAC